MASAITNQSLSSKETRRLIECPVCTETFRNPKSLPCGHSVCAECCKSLDAQGNGSFCPVCRKHSPISYNNLPINFVLRDLIDNSSPKSFVCGCKKDMDTMESWHCTDCNSVMCDRCALLFHREHKLCEIKKLVDDKEVQLDDIRMRYASTKAALDQSWDEINNRLTMAANVMDNAILLTHLAQMEAVAKKLAEELRNFDKRFDEVDAVSITKNDLNGQNIIFHLENDLSGIKRKEEQLSKFEKEIVEVTTKFNEDLIRIVSGYVALNDTSGSSKVFVGTVESISNEKFHLEHHLGPSKEMETLRQETIGFNRQLYRSSCSSYRGRFSPPPGGFRRRGGHQERGYSSDAEISHPSREGRHGFQGGRRGRISCECRRRGGRGGNRGSGHDSMEPTVRPSESVPCSAENDVTPVAAAVNDDDTQMWKRFSFGFFKKPI